MLVAVILLSLTALGGMVLATYAFNDRLPPKVLPVGHGLLGLAGIITLWRTGLTDPNDKQVIFALICLLMAAAGGLVMFFVFHMRERKLPKKFVPVHAALALLGLGLVIASYLNEGPPPPIP